MCNDPSSKLKGIPFVIEQLDCLTQGEWTDSGGIESITRAELSVISAINRCIGNIEGIRYAANMSTREGYPPLERK